MHVCPTLFKKLQTMNGCSLSYEQLLMTFENTLADMGWLFVPNKLSFMISRNKNKKTTYKMLLSIPKQFKKRFNMIINSRLTIKHA